MFKKIVVPLDGSALAEKALPYAANLAKMLEARLVLMRIVHHRPHQINDYRLVQGEIPTQPSPEYYNGMDQWSVSTMTYTPIPTQSEIEPLTVYSEEAEQAENALEQTRQKLINPALDFKLGPEQVQTLVVYNRPLFEIAQVAVEQEADLIVMTTHGRSGLSRLISGSVANQVVEHSTLPVVLIRPYIEDEKKTTHPATQTVKIGESTGPLVVTLDGTAEAEAALEPAVALAQAAGVQLHLLEVVQPLETVVTTDLIVLNMMDREDPAVETARLKEVAQDYLGALVYRLKEQGITNCTTEVRVGSPVAEIEDYARRIGALMLVMATHARGRIGELVLGSVAEEVVRQVRLPVMLVRRPV
jgi:nucleotide-binding universal stress UspA family protein